jgi:sarcosine oxidase
MSGSVIVLGLGAMGSAAAQHLAELGQRVIGIDRFTPPHSYGSSHGQTRIIRQSYWEDPRYVPLLLRAYELWRRLEADSGESLLHLTGGLMIGAADGDLVARSTTSALQFNLPHTVFSASEVRRLYPMFTVEDNMAALWEDAAGFLYPEACVQEQLNQAQRAGAELHYNEPVIEWRPLQSGGVSVRTALRTYEADRLIITAGPWAPEVLSTMKLPLEATRQVLYWFEPLATPELFHEGRFPIFLMQSESSEPLLYGFPSVTHSGPGHQDGVKVALHGSHDLCTPATIERAILPGDERAIRERLAQTMPTLAGRLLHAETCLYTMTPDEHFIVDQHPDHPQVTIAAGFSGHGFKFSSVIGEILAGMATGQPASYDLDLFSIRRFQANSLHLS